MMAQARLHLEDSSDSVCASAFVVLIILHLLCNCYSTGSECFIVPYFDIIVKGCRFVCELYLP